MRQRGFPMVKDRRRGQTDRAAKAKAITARGTPHARRQPEPPSGGFVIQSSPPQGRAQSQVSGLGVFAFTANGVDANAARPDVTTRALGLQRPK